MAAVNIKAVARLRPVSEDEVKVEGDIISTVDGGNTIVYDSAGQDKTFELDFSYAMDTTNQKVYSDVVAPLVLRVFDGYNASLIAYGSSASGQGYTLIGDEFYPGVIERATTDLFTRMQSELSSQYFVTISMMQIKQEVITDLLSPDLETNLNIEDHRSLGAHVKDLSEIVVHDSDECKEYILQAMKVMYALEKRNSSSGKPHIIIDIHVESRQNGLVVSPIRYATLRFVITSGSGGIAVEADPGLKSLNVVMESLAASKETYAINYNSSALTRILQHSLGGNAYTLFFATVNPCANHEQDTVRTLEMAVLARKVQNKPVSNRSALNETIQELRLEIKQARGKLALDSPGNYMNDIDPKLLEHWKHLLSELEVLKGQTWEHRIKQSQKTVHERKERLLKAGLYIVLEEEVKMDADLMRKVEKERRNLVLQTYVVEQKESQLTKDRERYDQLMQIGSADEKAAEEVSAELQQLAASIDEQSKALTHQQQKLLKMKSNFGKYIVQVVELEEKQRKTLLLAPESSRLYVMKDGEDWREIESLRGSDPKLRKKLKEIQAQADEEAGVIEQKFANNAEEFTPEKCKQIALDSNEGQKQLREKIEEIKWERDQLMGRLLERDFRHEAQMSRMQKQMFMVFREYRRTHEEQKRKLEARYRKTLQDSVQDALHLQKKNVQLQHQLESYQKAKGLSLGLSAYEMNQVHAASERSTIS